MSNSNDYSKGFIIGALVGGVAGAITALLLAPKSGAELRRDIADTSSDVYGKASDYFKQVEGQMNDYINVSKAKANDIVGNAKTKAESLLFEPEGVLKDAREKAIYAKDNVGHTIDNLKGAAKAGADAFKAELKSSENL